MSNKKTTTPETTPEKVMTKYDRKIQARREAELREKKEKAITKSFAILAVVAIIAIAIGIPVGKRLYAGREYLRVGNQSFSKIDYDFFYGNTANNFMSNYGIDLSSMEDTSGWITLFNQLTVENIRKYVALTEDAKKTNYSFDLDTEVDTYYSNLEAGAAESGLSLSKYIKAIFGEYATRFNIKDAVKMYVTSQSYYSHLYETNKPTDDEITAHYNENKDEYDNYKFHLFEVASKAADDASDEEKETALKEAETLAETFVNRVNAGESFTTLCAEYAADDKKGDYTAESDASLKSVTGYTSLNASYRGWILDSERKEGEAAFFKDTSNDVYYVVSFVSRTFDEETQKEEISAEIASEATDSYLSELVKTYEVVDKYNLRGIEETEDSDTASDSGENTDSAENNTAENE